MSFKRSGIKWHKNIKVKVGLALIISNVMCLALFPSCKSEISPTVSPHLVDVQIQAELFTGFEKGKKAGAIHPRVQRKIEILLKEEKNETGRITVETNKQDARLLLSHTQWRIIPEIDGEVFEQSPTVANREIHY